MLVRALLFLYPNRMASKSKQSSHFKYFMFIFCLANILTTCEHTLLRRRGQTRYHWLSSFNTHKDINLIMAIILSLPVFFCASRICNGLTTIFNDNSYGVDRYPWPNNDFKIKSNYNYTFFHHIRWFKHRDWEIQSRMSRSVIALNKKTHKFKWHWHVNSFTHQIISPMSMW